MKDIRPEMSLREFLDLIRAGMITTRVVTLALVGAALYMWLTGTPMDKAQEVVTIMVMAFCFSGETFAHYAKFILEKYLENKFGLIPSTPEGKMWEKEEK